MKQVFTRWPRGSDAGKPRVGAGPPLQAGAPESRALVALLGFAVAATALSTLVLVAPAPPFSQIIWLNTAVLVACVVVVVGIIRMRTRFSALNAEVAELRRWNRSLFEDIGVSLWREDWSAARVEVDRLLRSGVTDVQAHYTARPDDLRDLRGRVIIKDVNPFALERMGVTSKEAVVGPLARILPDTDQTFVQWLVAFASGDRVYRSETHLVRPDGTAIDTLFTAAIPDEMAGYRDVVVVDFDITEYKRAQARLLELERDLIRSSGVSTMGAFSATIAQEVNSPIAAIVSHAEAGLRWLDREQPDHQEVKAAIGSVVADATRVRNVIERIRVYLAAVPSASEPHDFVRSARDALLILDDELRDGLVSLHFDADDDVPLVPGNAVQLQQVLVNLVLNAVHAMRNVAPPRDLTVTVRRTGDHVHVRVHDVGEGIDPSASDQIFDLFHSTKAGGLGLGLAICKTVVEGRGGRIWMTGRLGEGTAFHFIVPSLNDDPSTSRTPSEDHTKR